MTDHANTITGQGHKYLPRALTSYDFLKALALVTMVIDHLGYYLFPEDEVWRVIGRMSFPIWLFLIGYARSTAISRRLLIGAILVGGAAGIVGTGFIPLNILFTIILARLIRPYLVRVAFKNLFLLLTVLITLFLLVLPSAIYVADYGTQALIFMLFGYAARGNRDQPEKSSKEFYWLSALMAMCSMMYQHVLFGFEGGMMLMMYGLCAVVLLLLLRFKSETYPALTERLPHFAVKTLQLMGRRTLEIYVIHVLLLLALSVWMYPEEYTLFDGQWIAGGPF